MYTIEPSYERCIVKILAEQSVCTTTKIKQKEVELIFNFKGTLFYDNFVALLNIHKKNPEILDDLT